MANFNSEFLRLSLATAQIYSQNTGFLVPNNSYRVLAGAGNNMVFRFDLVFRILSHRCVSIRLADEEPGGGLMESGAPSPKRSGFISV